ncbi:hypothetical protein NDA15_000434 [Ustilago hordei]|nr:hypothetical protein NDA15_000434 [Ustilago hordei]
MSSPPNPVHNMLLQGIIRLWSGFIIVRCQLLQPNLPLLLQQPILWLLQWLGHHWNLFSWGWMMTSSSPVPFPPPFLASAAQSLMGNDYSLASPEIDLYEVDARCPAVEMMTPEHQAVWEAELARSATPPPMADKVIDAVLDAHHPSTPVYQLEVQPLTPPPCWVEHQTPPLPPPNQHLPTNGEIARWSERFFVAELMAWFADQYFPLDWDVPAGSLPKCCLHQLVMLCLTKGCMPWPSWQCHWCFNLGTP